MAYLGTKPANAVLTSEQIGDGVITQADLSTGVAGTGPAFSVSRITSMQFVTAATYTKVQFNSVNFDTDSDWNAANYRFIPSVAGYYQFNLTILTQIETNTDREIIGTIWKNGSEAALAITALPAYQVRGTAQVSSVIYMNGTTDYVEAYGYISGGTTPYFVLSSSRTQFSGCLVRAA
jgi:hypothetical protein